MLEKFHFGKNIETINNIISYKNQNKIIKILQNNCWIIFFLKYVFNNLLLFVTNITKESFYYFIVKNLII